MAEDEVKTEQNTAEETTQEEQETPAPAAKTPKKAKAAAGGEAAAAKVEKGKKPAAIEEILAAIKNMTVLDLSQLVKAMETEFGISAAAPVMAATAAATPTETPAAPEEQTEFNVILKDIGANKINVIRAVRELTALGLKESKDMVESAPVTVKEKVSKEEAATAKEKLDASGATAEIQ